MSFKSVFITGANRGLGLEFVRQLLALPKPPAHVFAACRDPVKATELADLAATNSALKILKLDVSDISSFETIKNEIGRIVEDNGLNLLINNAGVNFRDGIDDVKEDTMMESFKINTVAPLMLLKALRPLMKTAASRGELSVMVNLSSVLASIENSTGGLYSYRVSKAALNMASRTLSHDLKQDGIITISVHPGWAQTDMGGANATVKPKDSIDGLLKVVSELTPQESGNFYEYTGRKMDW